MKVSFLIPPLMSVVKKIINNNAALNADYRTLPLRYSEPLIDLNHHKAMIQGERSEKNYKKQRMTPKFGPKEFHDGHTVV